MRKTIWLALAASLLTAGCGGFKMDLTSPLAPRATVNCIAKNVDVVNPGYFKSKIEEYSGAEKFTAVGVKTIEDYDVPYSKLHYQVRPAPQGSRIHVHSSGVPFDPQKKRGVPWTPMTRKEAIALHLKGCVEPGPAQPQPH